LDPAYHFDADSDPDPACHLDANPTFQIKAIGSFSIHFALSFANYCNVDPDPAYHVDADPDPTFQFDKDPDPHSTTLVPIVIFILLFVAGLLSQPS
jgi:hypothetical protein